MRTLLLLVALFTPLESFDWAAQQAVQSLRTPGGDKVMSAVSKAGRPRIVIGALLGIALFSGPAGVVTARQAVFALLPTNLVVEGLKRAVDRTRPDGEHNRSNASFPSSHAANAFALALVLSRRWRRLLPAFWSLAAVVSFSRVYLNRHFVTDVTVGALIGVGVAWLVLWWLEKRAKAPKTAE